MHIFLAKIADTAAGAVRWRGRHDGDDLTDLIRNNRRGRTGMLAFVAKREMADLRHNARLTTMNCLTLLANNRP
eukprot:343281-Lingulodinium_polyedra.AAC.1